MKKFFGMTPTPTVVPRDAFDSLLAETIEPLLQEQAFTKRGTSFYRQRGDIIDVINFQSSQSNRSDLYKFYVNCGLDSLAVQKVTAAKTQRRPSYFNCLYNQRIGQLSSSQRADYTIITETDMAQLQQEIETDLKAALDFYQTITNTANLVDTVIAVNKLQQYETISGYLAQTHELSRLVIYVSSLHVAFGDQPRWPTIAERITALIGNYAVEPRLGEYLATGKA